MLPGERGGKYTIDGWYGLHVGVFMNNATMIPPFHSDMLHSFSDWQIMEGPGGRGRCCHGTSDLGRDG